MVAYRKFAAGTLTLTNDETGEPEVEVREPDQEDHADAAVVFEFHADGDRHCIHLSQGEMEALLNYLGDIVDKQYQQEAAEALAISEGC